MSTKYVSALAVKQTFEVSTSSLRRWAAQGKVKCKRMEGGKRLYLESDVAKLFHDEGAAADNNAELLLPIEQQPAARVNICYARVSSSHQQADLERQCTALQAAYPEYELIKDIGSGLNWKRAGFLSLLERVHACTVDEVVVAHKDRLCRFGFELVEWIIRKGGAKLVVHDAQHPSSAASDAIAPHNGQHNELADDLLSIITVFVARNNGLRSAENRRQRKRKAAEAANGASTEASSSSSITTQSEGNERDEE
jgi:putative resolvase